MAVIAVLVSIVLVLDLFIPDAFLTRHDVWTRSYVYIEYRLLSQSGVRSAYKWTEIWIALTMVGILATLVTSLISLHRRAFGALAASASVTAVAAFFSKTDIYHQTLGFGRTVAVAGALVALVAAVVGLIRRDPSPHTPPPYFASLSSEGHQ